MKNNKKNYSIAAATLIGLLIAFVLLLLYTCIVSAMILNGKLNDRVTIFIEPIILMIALYIGTMLSLKRTSQGYLMIAGLTAVSFMMIQVAVNIIAFDAEFHSPWIEFLAVFSGALLACITTLKTTGKKTGKHRYR